MPLVVLLRGVNVGGHRTFRPAALARDLAHLGAVSIGAAGTFVIRQPVSVAALRAEFARRLPFETEIMICQGRDVTRLLARDPFAGHATRADVVPFVSLLARAPRPVPAVPFNLPDRGQWLLTILGRDRRFVFGLYRRHMKAIGCLGTLDRIFGVPVTTRNWNTVAAIARAIEA
jgi:uncharacterized protein (DUF1697 family)